MRAEPPAGAVIDDPEQLLAPVPGEFDQTGATPVIVVTGFLGAGKTTLVNRILGGDHQLRIAVIVNDFGDVNVDSELVVSVDNDTISLANGCVCCEVRDDLVRAIRSVLAQDASLDAIVVEASGVAESSGIARTFLTGIEPGLARLDALVAMVDAERLPDQVVDPAIADLVYGQIGYSDLVVLNKIDLADRARLAGVRSFVEQRLPGLRIVEATRAGVPMDVLLPIVGPRTHRHRTLARHHGHEHRFVTWTYRRTDPFDAAALQRTIAELPPHIYRIKGFLKVEHDTQRRHLLQAVGMRAEIHAFDEWDGRPPETNLVVIADRDADRSAIEERFDLCRRRCATGSTR